jgi:Zn-dependent peptidase ImmA (M78 family)
VLGATAVGFYFHEPNVTPAFVPTPELEHNQALLRFVFAKELGHHSTSVGDMLFRSHRSDMGHVLLSKTEKQAFRWAAQLLMQPMEAVAIAHEVETVHDLGERFDVRPAFVRAAFQLPVYARLLDMLRARPQAL